MKTKQLQKNELQIKATAYIFDSSNERFIYSKEQRLENHERQKLLKKYAGDVVKFEKTNPGYYTVKLEGLVFNLKPCQIFRVGDNSGIINYLEDRPLNNFDKIGYIVTIYRTSTNASHRKLKTLNIEEFMQSDSLRYYRLKFKQNRLDFVIDYRDKKIYTHPDYMEVSLSEIKDIMQCESVKAQRELVKIINFIKFGEFEQQAKDYIIKYGNLTNDEIKIIEE